MSESTQTTRQYWEQRAKESAGKPNATTNDIYLRELEIRTIIETLRQFQLVSPSRILDLGCGDGFSTTRVAEQFAEASFTGMDFSENMIATAKRRLAELPALKTHVEFRVGDVSAVAQIFEPATADVVITDRCLINLESAHKQYDAIRQIHGALKNGGHYMAIENFVEGNIELNQARARIGLKEIPIRWHNLFFKENEFLMETEKLFSTVQMLNFSSAYYFATRVVYAKYCLMRNEEPDYRHEIHKLAIDLPPIGAFSPIKLAILTK